MEHIQVLARMLFRAFVVAMLTINFDPKAIYGLPLGVIIAILTEAEYLTKKK